MPAKKRATKKPATRSTARKAAALPSPKERLATYRRKRDFTVTSEPSGEHAPPALGSRFVVQRHRASALHYDLRLEAAGVLLSWAVPKGPTLDPDVRRMAIHVEDHPLDYFDFEGVIPAGEYGGGDVIVWDWGTWKLAEADDAIEAVVAGSLHFDLHGSKLAGRFALVRRGTPGGREQWLLIHKHDDSAVKGWDPEQHPESVKTGRTNDEVKAAPAATWSSNELWRAATDDELAALDAMPKTGGRWQLGEHTLKLIDATGFWHKARPAHAPDFVGSWHNPDADPGETEIYSVLANPAALVWAANFGGIELHPWTSTAAHPHRPSWALFDIDPGESTTFDDVLTLARLHRTALDHLGVEGCAKVTGSRGIQIWVPVADRYTFDDTRTWVEQLSRAIGATVPEMVSWEWGKAKRNGLARLDYTQNAINKTLVAPFSVRPRPGAPVSVPITWDELDDPELRPDRWTIATVGERLREKGDPLAPLIGRQQRLPKLSE